MIYKEKPENFISRFEVVSCYLECQGNILLLHRPKHKSQGGKWGVPAGKIDPGENPNEALIREIREETGIELTNESLNFLNKVFVRYPDYDFVYYMYKASLNELPEVQINIEEHQGYEWRTPKESLELELVKDMAECIRMYY